MTADTYTWRMDVRIGLGIRSSDRCCGIKTMRVGIAGKLIGQGDIDIAVRRLYQLNKFGVIGRSHGNDLGVKYRPVKRNSNGSALLIDPAHYLGIESQITEDIARRDTLRTECKKEIATGLKL